MTDAIKATREKVLAIIPARAGSKRLPGKNTRLFKGKPLIAHTIIEAKRAKIFDRIVVDTDSSAIATIAKKYGAEVPFLRPASLAKDTNPMQANVLFLLRRLRSQEGYVPTMLALLQVTTPGRTAEDILDCYWHMQKNRFASVATVHQTDKWLYYLDNSSALCALRTTKTGHDRNFYAPNGGVFLIRTDLFLRKKKFLIEGITRAVTKPWWRFIDIDFAEDWTVAELLHTHQAALKQKISSLNQKIAKAKNYKKHEY